MRLIGRGRGVVLCSNRQEYSEAGDTDLALSLREMIHKSDGYYLKDYGALGLDAKLVKSLALTVQGTSAKAMPAIVANVGAIDNGVTVWEFGIGVSDRTISSNKYTNGVFCAGGMETSYRGTEVLIEVDKIRVRVSDGSVSDDFVSANAITVSDIQNSYVTFDTTTMNAKKVYITTPAGTETFNCKTTLTGSINVDNSARVYLGGFSSCFIGTYAYFRVKRNGTYTVDIPFSTNQVNYATNSRSQYYELYTETLYENPVNGNKWVFTNDVRPTNCIKGFDLYQSTGLVDVYVPHRADGSSISVNQTGNVLTYKIGTPPNDYLAYGYALVENCKGYDVATEGHAAGWNFSETQIQLNPTNNATLTAGGYPDTMFIGVNDLAPPNAKTLYSVTNDLIVSGILLYYTDKTEAERQSICAYLGLTPRPVALISGDSIAEGVALKADLPDSLKIEQPHCKIWIVNSNSLTTFSNLNGSQPPYSSTNDSYIGIQPRLVQLYNTEMYIVMWAKSGATLGGNWRADTGDYFALFIKAIRRSYKHILADGSYPVYVQYATVGSNDHTVPGYVAGFKDLLIANQLAIRATVKQDAPCHFLRCVQSTAGRISIASDVDECAQGDIPNFYAYNGDAMTNNDGTHPDPTNCAGYIQLAEWFYGKNYIIYT